MFVILSDLLILGSMDYKALTNFSRYQKGWKLHHLYPNVEGGHCSCGCGKALSGRQTRWASESCSEQAYYNFAILKGNTTAIRKALYLEDKGFCRQCGIYDKEWQADHILPVLSGGGLCQLDNFQTLCYDCHCYKTKCQMVSHRRTISSQAAFNEWRVRL